MSRIAKAQDLMDQFTDQSLAALEKLQRQRQRQGNGTWFVLQTQIDSKSLSCSVDAKRAFNVEDDGNWQSNDKVINEFIKGLRRLGYVVIKEKEDTINVCFQV